MRPLATHLTYIEERRIKKITVLQKMRLDGNTALIIGQGNSWLPELADSFADAGAKVAVIYPEITATEEKVRAALALPVTEFSREKIEAAVDTVVREFGRIDILVNSYNLEWCKPALETSETDWDHVMDANLKAVFFSSQIVGKGMIAAGQGSIVNIASALGDSGVINMSAYCASMGGIFTLTKALALEWAAKGIRINTIGVGWRDNTEMQTDDRSEASLLRYIPARHRCQPEEVMPLAVFLASASASYISGHVFFVDGGLNARA